MISLLRQHARRRAKERFGIKLTRNLRASLVADIRAGRAAPLDRDCHTPTRQMFLVVIAHRTIKVVYDAQANDIVTFMRPGRTL